MYNSYRYVASPIIDKAHETELTMAGITATSWSTMVSSRLVGSTSETNVYCGTAHGECSLGDPGNTALCANPGCALCSIICGSFDVSKVATNTNWARFGAGIYTSSVSSK